jgi:hypothetical protein
MLAIPWGIADLAQATEVGGGIFFPTVWKAEDSPFHVVSDVMLFQYVLTVEPGVEIQFQPGVKMTLRGSLSAMGTQQQPIRWSAISPGQWGGIRVEVGLGGTIQVQFCEFSDASIAIEIPDAFAQPSLKIVDSRFLHNGVGVRADNNVLIGRCVFEGHDAALTGADADVWNCVFQDNVFGLKDARKIDLHQCLFLENQTAIHGGDAFIEQCEITANGIGLSQIYTGYEMFKNLIKENGRGVEMSVDGQRPISRNDFIGNDIHLALLGPRSAVATLNWWGTTDPSQIDAKIHDGHDDINLGLVGYIPLSTSPNISPNSVEASSWGRIKSFFRN